MCVSRYLHAPLQALPGKLTLHEADLLKKGSFDEVVKVRCVVQAQAVPPLFSHEHCYILQGVDFVFHMASPFLASWEDTQKELVEPALNGTSTVLESVAKYKGTIRRVVLTSSFAGMFEDISFAHFCNMNCGCMCAVIRLSSLL